MRIGVLGPVRLWGDDGAPVSPGPAGQRGVLALLTLAGGRPLSRGELVDTLWQQRPPATVANVIQTYVKRLRRVLEPDRRPRSLSRVLPGVGDGYALRVDPEDVDLYRFRRLVAAAATARHAGDPARAAALLAAALALWDGQPLVDVPALAGHPKVVALVEERYAALGGYGDALVAAGAAVDALPALEEVVAARPFDEAQQARLIRAYQAAGRRARAFERYHQVRRLLGEELGVDPGPELAAAHTALLHAAGAPATPVVPAARKPGDDASSRSPRTGRPVPAPVTAPAPARVAPAQLPADVAGFTGRAVELSALDSLLDAVDRSAATPGGPPPATAVVLSGTAGVGKTALAVRWAHRVRHRFPDGQLHVDLRGYDPDRPVPPGDALASFLRSLGVAGADVPVDLDERAARFRSLLDGRRMLLILDNAASVEQVQPLLPGAPSCVALVTSRDLLPALVARHGARRIGLDLLPPGDAADLVRVLVGDRIEAEPDAVAALIRQCARLPLALRVAAELILARPGAPLAELVGELADQQRRLELLDAGGNQRTGVQAVFSWSYQHLPPDAARLFRTLGLHPGPDVDGHAAAALSGADLAATRRALACLARAHLVHRSGAGRHDRYELHDLLRAYAQVLAAAADTEPDRRAALGRALDHYVHTAATAIDMLFPAERDRRPVLLRPEVPAPARPAPALPDRAAAQSWLDAERANLVAAAVHASAHGWPRHAVQLAVTLLRYLEGGGHHAEAGTVHEAGLRAARRLGDRGGEARIRTDQAVILAQQGRYEQAAAHLRQAAEICRQTGDTAGEARAVGNLGHILQREGRHAEATDHLHRAVLLCRRAGDRTGEARALGNLGHVYQRQGRHAEATDHLQRAIAICRSAGDAVGEAYALGSLGQIRCDRGEHEAAVDHHRRALALFRQTGERAGEASALVGLGDAHLGLADLPTAAGYLDEALLRYRQLGEPAGEAQALTSVGEAREAAGLPAEAYAHHREALALAVEIGDQYQERRARAGLARTHPAGPDSPVARAHRERALTADAALGAAGLAGASGGASG